ncbi:MAG: AAA family ATPase [Leptospirillum sp.]
MDAKKGAPAERDATINNQRIDFTETESFLQALDPMGAFTFQSFDDTPRKESYLAKVFHGSFSEHRDELARLNKTGAGIFVTVNKTDLRGRKAENITGIRAVFLDLDGAPLPSEWLLEPHLIIESSPGRYHVYYLVEPGFPLDRFESVQKAIAARFNGDPAVSDLPRVMRITGFIHRKGEPFRSRIVQDHSLEPRYSAEQILKAFPPVEEPTKVRPDSGSDDPVLKALEGREMVIRQDRTEKGKYIIACPWADQHTDGNREAAFWLKNHGGFEGYGFRCLHGHCVDRTVKDLKEVLGIGKKTKIREVFTRKVSSVEARPIEWLWPGYFPEGALCLLDGDPGLGKSFLTLDLAARVSAGKHFPTGEKATPGGVVILSYEDDPGVTIRPRLETMGADLDRIVLLEGVTDDKGPRLPHVADIEAIREAVKEIDARLVIVDPLMAALPGAVDSHSDQNVRSVLAPLSRLSQETRTTVIVVRHLNKSGGGSPLYRGGGSIGIVAAARAAFLVGKDPKDEARRILAVTKLNVAPEPTSLAYRIVVNLEGNPFLSWEGQTDVNARDLLEQAEKKSRNAPKRELAREFLEERLKDGPVESETILSEASEREISRETLMRVKKEMGILSHREGGSSGEWFWSLKSVTPPIQKDDDTLYRKAENTRQNQRVSGLEIVNDDTLKNDPREPEDIPDLDEILEDIG